MKLIRVMQEMSRHLVDNTLDVAARYAKIRAKAAGEARHVTAGDVAIALEKYVSDVLHDLSRSSFFHMLILKWFPSLRLYTHAYEHRGFSTSIVPPGGNQRDVPEIARPTDVERTLAVEKRLRDAAMSRLHGAGAAGGGR